MLTLSIEVDETVENYLRSKDIDTISYLGKLIQQDMLSNAKKTPSLSEAQQYISFHGQ